jgi:hypothetical protein
LNAVFNRSLNKIILSRDIRKIFDNKKAIAHKNF